MSELSPDQKGRASLTLGEVVVRTRRNFPDPRFQPKVHFDSNQYHIYGINPHPYQIRATADGIGTKPELAERLYDMDCDTRHFESLAYDTFAMIDGDTARFGEFLLGIANVIDTNTADQGVIDALARGAKDACDDGHFALLNGETAELGYKVSGYGQARLNWNAVGINLINSAKLLTGSDLKPGLPIVGLEEISVRSNGFTKIRQIMEAVYLDAIGCSSKEEYVLNELSANLGELTNRALPEELHSYGIIATLDNLIGHDFLEQVLIPWHEYDPKLTEALLTPSTLYGPLMYSAQGGVDGQRDINLVAAAHITGGGIPEKIRRMLAPKGLGAHIETVFSDPHGIQEVLKLAGDLSEWKKDKLIDDKRACEQWNRGIGFVTVVKTKEDVEQLFMLGQRFNIRVSRIGEVLAEPRIEFHGHTWTY